MKKAKRKLRYFGVVKMREGVKLAWLAKEDKNGWALGLGLNSRNVWLKGLRFRSRKEIERVLEKTGVVFIHLANSTAKK